MATTTNFGWETPDDTDLVKDGALAIRTLGSAIDTSLVDLKGGTTGQVLSKTSNTDMDFTWVTSDDANAIQNAIVDAKGDLITATAADTPARLAVGTNGQVLTADSTTATGLKWATAGTPSAWTSFTPTVTASSGTITTYTANGYYVQDGSICIATYRIVLTNVGTAAGSLIATLPITAATKTNGKWVGSVLEYNTSGKTGAFNIDSGATVGSTRDYNFVTWFTNNYNLVITIVYEV
jgi:hypothetical protein